MFDKNWTCLGFAVSVAMAMGCGAEAGEADLDAVHLGIGGSTSGTEAQFYNGKPGYNGVQDTTIEAAAPGTSQGSAPECGADGLDQERSCLIFFDLSSVPTAATVLSARLDLFVTQPSASTYELFALKLPWSGVAGTTWNSRLLITPWLTPGAKSLSEREAVPFASFVPHTDIVGGIGGSVNLPGAGPQRISFGSDGVLLVRNWVRNPSSNFGFIIARADTPHGMAIRSSETAQPLDRPRLTLRYKIYSQ
jgi:hypothetical protein